MDIDLLKDELKSHGELHLVIDEHEAVAGDEYIGIRLGNTEFNDGLIRVDDGRTEHVIDSDSVIYFEKPVDFPD